LSAGRVTTYLAAAAAAAVVVAMVASPEIAFNAAVQGLELWWNVVFPALLPFFIGSEILMGLGVVHFMGVLLEPLMRPLFCLPGCGSFVVAMGLASGYPIGAVLTSRLRKRNMCSRVEGERLMSFANTADPLFMSGAVAVGMFGNAALAPIIMGAHYLASISTGLILRFYGRSEDEVAALPRPDSPLAAALRALVEAREADGRALGKLLGDAARNSVNTLLMIGGFIILFSVIIRILAAAGILRLLAAAALGVLGPLGLTPSLAEPLVGGVLEITIGSRMAAEAAAPIEGSLVVVSALIAWSGLSVHAQVAAIIQDTDLTMFPYSVSRILHSAFAAAYTVLILYVWPHAVEASRALPTSTPAPADGAAAWIERLTYACGEFGVTAGLCLLLSLALLSRPPFRVIAFRSREGDR